MKRQLKGDWLRRCMSPCIRSATSRKSFREDEAAGERGLAPQVPVPLYPLSNLEETIRGG
jgi:hypothetical protein